VSIRVIARLVSRPETAVELRGLLTPLVPPTRKETGCISYELLESRSRPGDFVFVEEWESQEILDRHLAMPYLRDMLAKAPPLLEQQVSVGIYSLLA